MRARFPALISVGGTDRFLEDLSPGIPRNQFFGKVAEANNVQHVNLGWILGFSGHPGPSGLNPGPKTPSCRARARTSPVIDFLGKMQY